MHIKHLKKGTGDSKNCADYLTQMKGSTGKTRDRVEILRGDPYQVAAVAASLRFKHKYTSGLITWAPEDKPTDAEIQAVINDYEKTAFAGLAPDRYSFTAVLHVEIEKGIHVHTLTARVDLATGKSMNIAPPNHEYRFDMIRDYYNYSKGWAKPDDPERARLNQPGYYSYIAKAKARLGIKEEYNEREVIGAVLEQRVAAGEIENRQDIMSALHEMGLETPRAGRNYITVLDPETGDRYRLKGALYNEDFEYGQFEREAERELREGPTAYRRIDEERAERAWRQIEKHREQRAEFNQKKYSTGVQTTTHFNIDRDRNDKERSGPERDPERSPRPEKSADQCMVAADTDRDKSLSRYLSRQLGDDALPVSESSGTVGRKSTDRKRDYPPSIPSPKSQYGRTGTTSSDRAANKQEPEWDVLNPALRDDTPGRVLGGKSTSSESEELDHGFNGIREKFARIITTISKTAERNNQQLAAASERVGQIRADLNGRIQCPRKTLLRIGEQIMNDELTKFKQEIDLAEYAASRGFEKDTRKSSARSMVMVRDDEKIGISVNRRTGDQNYHHFGRGMGGTVIDFCQHEIGQNLGHVRKELRAFLGAPKPTMRSRLPPRLTREQQAQALANDKHTASPISGSNLYLEARGISRQTLADNRFRNRIFVDPRGNVCFPHFNSKGFSGFEKKNYQFTGFSRGGEKALWGSTMLEGCGKIVVCESGIDCLSHAQLHPGNKAAYLSTGGQLSAYQKKQLHAVIDRHLDKIYVAAFDNDTKGWQYTDELEAIIDGAADFEVHYPERTGQDWNDMLKENDPEPNLTG